MSVAERTGIEALEAIAKDPPDVVLVDVNMPRMNGIDTTREIHRLWPHITIIGLSVQDDDATAKAMLEAGAAAFVPKSGESDLLIETIVKLAGRQEDEQADQPLASDEAASKSAFTTDAAKSSGDGPQRKRTAKPKSKPKKKK